MNTSIRPVGGNLVMNIRRARVPRGMDDRDCHMTS